MKTAKLPYKIALRVRRSKARVFIPSDFSDLSGYDQILRVLRKMVRGNQLVRIGQGIYAKAKTRSDGTVAPVGFIGVLAGEALKKYGVKTGNSSALNAYNANVSTQVPNGRVIAVSKRVRRKIGFNGYGVGFEMMNKRYKSRWFNRENIKGISE